MITEDFTKDVLSQIKDQKISPRPRWQFSLKNYLLWFLVFLATGLGALAVTTIIFLLTDYDWDVLSYLHCKAWSQIFVVLPYLWLVSLTFLLLTIFYNFRHIKGGYHYEAYKIIAASVSLSVLLGVIMFFCGIDSEIHERLMGKFPFYSRVVQTNRNLWIYPEAGLLAGSIKTINGDQGFFIEDLHGNIWMVATDTQTIWDCCDGRPATNTIIKIVGKKQGDNNFRARDIRRWNKRLIKNGATPSPLPPLP